MTNSRFHVYVYTCSVCGHQEENPDTDGYDTDFCTECGEETKVSHTRPPSWVSVAVYDTWRDYGGPEEGGWYYDAGSLSRELAGKTVITESLEEAEAAIKRLNDEYGGTATKIKWFCEEFPPKRFPAITPRYC